MTTSNEHNNAPAVPQDMRIVPVWLLERVERSLGAFTSDEGLAQTDMDTMDSVSALIAAAPAPALTCPEACKSPEKCCNFGCQREALAPAQGDAPDPTLSAMMGMPVSRKVWAEFKARQADKEEALRAKEDK